MPLVAAPQRQVALLFGLEPLAIVNLNVAFKPAFTGFKGVWVAVQSAVGAKTSSWQALGSWRPTGN